MEDFLMLMWKPLFACLILTGIHVYLGVHIVERQVIFVDLALAQIAALGIVVALLFGFDHEHVLTYWFALGATFIGAVVFACTRSRRQKIPQEAIIGIVYAMAASLAILLLSHSPEGDEHVRHMLVGNILLVNLSQIIKMAVLYAVIGLIHWRFRKVFLLISTDPQEAYRQGVSIRFWDLVFYITFGVIVTSSVEIAGVLLVFSYLIVPAVSAILFCSTFKGRLIFGWIFGVIVSSLGLSLSYVADLPTGASVACTFGAGLVVLSLVRSLYK